MENWDNAVVVDSRELQRLRDEHAKLQKASRKQRLLLLVLAGGCAVTGLGLYMGALRLTATERYAKECRKTAMRSNVALAALARSHENIDRKSTRLNSSHLGISYAVFCLKKKK